MSKAFSDYDFPKLIRDADTLREQVRWAVCAWAFVFPENLKDDVPIEECCLHNQGFPDLSKIGMLVGLQYEYPKLRIRDNDVRSLHSVDDFVQFIEEQGITNGGSPQQEAIR
jgi:hypothetical protein